MKILKKTIKGIYISLVILLILSATFLVLTTYDVIPKYNFYVVMSGSMQPAIKVGSVIGVKQEETYDVGDIITIPITGNPANTLTHRITQTLVDENEVKYITKGDANKAEDFEPVSKDSVIGKTFLSIPLIGYIVNFAKQPTGFILMIITPAIIIIASELNVIKEELTKIINSKRKKK